MFQSTESGADRYISDNACYNLIGDPDTIRDCIEIRAALPISNDTKAKIIVCRGERTRCDDSETELLYPDIDTYHAVVNRMKEAAAAC